MSVPNVRRSGNGWTSTAIDTMLWVAAIGFVVATLVYSLGPPPAALRSFPNADKVAHALGYAAMTLTWLLAAVWRPGRQAGDVTKQVKQAVLIVGGAILLGSFVEVAQHSFHRDADVVDAMADAAGALAGLIAWTAMRSMARPATAD